MFSLRAKRHDALQEEHLKQENPLELEFLSVTAYGKLSPTS